MAKDQYYFSHDYNARNDKKISALVREFKSAGYGIYWCAAEMLHEEGGVLELDDLTLFAISKDLNEDFELVKVVIEKCVSTFKLFYVLEDNILTANRVKRNLDKRKEISKARSDAGKAGANAKQMQANAKQMQAIAEQNQAKERKGKEIKENINTGVQGKVEKVNVKLHGVGEFEIDVFDKCERWQYDELKSFISGSQQNFESIAMTNRVIRVGDNFKTVLQAFVAMIQSTNEYQESNHLRKYFANWVAKKNGTLENYIEDIKKSNGVKKLSVNDYI